MEWYGERVTHHLFKGVAPDGYGVLALPGRPPVLLLLEPRSELGEYGTFVILAVPTATRAKLAREAVADTGAPIEVTEWSKASTRSPLAIVTDAAGQLVARRSA
jgi:hypothetical protein